MRKFELLAVFIIMFLSTCLPCHTDGIMLPGHGQNTSIKEPEQKAVIYFSKGQETLIISPRYEGSAADFAWLIPVPSKPSVEIGDYAIFKELAVLTDISPLSPDEQPPVEVLEQKTIGDYDVSLLECKAAADLMDWLNKNNYHLPDEASKPIADYIKAKWTFVACRIHDPESSETGLHAGTLAPIQLKFASNRPVYPLKMSSANPEPFDLLVYLILPKPV